MSLLNEQQLRNARAKLALVEERIAKARHRPPSPERDVSICSLLQTANQLKEEIVRYESRAKLKNVV